MYEKVRDVAMFGPIQVDIKLWFMQLQS